MSSPSPTRSRLLADLDRELRTLSTRSVLLSQAVAGRLGIGPTDLETMEILVSQGPLTAGRLAELTGLTSGAITGVVDRLERAGYVRRERDAADRRRVIVHLVPERTRRIWRLFEPMGRAMADLHGRYTDAELALLLEYVRRGNEISHAVTARIEGGGTARTQG